MILSPYYPYYRYECLDSDTSTISLAKLILRVPDKSGGNYLIHRDILRHQVSQRQGTVSTKTRSEVRGGGKKPWRQKGTGRARAGSSRSPLWKGGGVIFGPKPKTVNLKLNKKERNLALQTLLVNKKQSGNLRVIEKLEQLSKPDGSPKTRPFCDGMENLSINVNEKLLFIVSEKTLFLKLATRNLKNVELISASHLNTLSLLKAKTAIISVEALNALNDRFANELIYEEFMKKEIDNENKERN